LYLPEGLAFEFAIFIYTKYHMTQPRDISTTIVAIVELGKERLRLYKELKKVESSILI